MLYCSKGFNASYIEGLCKIEALLFYYQYVYSLQFR